MSNIILNKLNLIIFNHLLTLIIKYETMRTIKSMYGEIKYEQL